MTAIDRESNESAFAAMREELERRFPNREYVAFGRGRMVADATTFDTLLDKLKELGWNPSDVLVVRPADEPRGNPAIFSPLLRPPSS